MPQLHSVFLFMAHFHCCILALTCVGETPTVFIVAQQAAKVKLELLQVHL